MNCLGQPVRPREGGVSTRDAQQWVRVRLVPATDAEGGSGWSFCPVRSGDGRSWMTRRVSSSRLLTGAGQVSYARVPIRPTSWVRESPAGRPRSRDVPGTFQGFSRLSQGGSGDFPPDKQGRP